MSTFARDTGLALGGTLVKSGRSGIPLLVVNPTENPVVLPRGMVAATGCAAAGVKAFSSGKIPSGYCAEVGMKEGCAELPEYLEARLPQSGLTLAQICSMKDPSSNACVGQLSRIKRSLTGRCRRCSILT